MQTHNIKIIILLFFYFYSNLISAESENFNKIVLSMEKKSNSFIEKTDMSIFYYIITQTSPSLSISINAERKLDFILSKNLNSKNLIYNKNWEDFFYVQSVLDNLYFAKKRKFKIRMELKKYNWEKYNLKDSSENIILNYIFRRILNDLKFRTYNIKEMENGIENEISKDKFYYGYFLTHIILYDSNFFSKRLNLKDYYIVLKKIAKLTKFAISNNHYDLASELYMSLSYFQLFGWNEFKKLDKFLFEDDTVLQKIINGGIHLKAVYSVAYAMRYESTSVKKGFVRIKDKHIYYEIYGHNYKNTPIVILSGGPGWSHDVMIPLLPFSKERQILFYDQMGTGKSSKNINWNNVTTVDYVNNLHNLLKHLKWNKVILLGHSWGTMVSLDYTLAYQNGVEKLILSSPVISGKDWIRDTALKFNKIRDSYKGKDSLFNVYNRKYVISDMGIYEHLLSSFNENPYKYLWGESEYQITGWTKNYDKQLELYKLKLPVMITAGEYDEMSLDTIKKWNSKIKNSSYKILLDTNHIHYLDKNAEYLNIVNNFMNEKSH